MTAIENIASKKLLWTLATSATTACHQLAGRRTQAAASTAFFACASVGGCVLGIQSTFSSM